MHRVVILTGNEIRHQYFRRMMALDQRFVVLASYCEDVQQSLSHRVLNNPDSSTIERQHVEARIQSEVDFFGPSVTALQDRSHSKTIPKGEINSAPIVSEIEQLQADLLVCYGTSLIKSTLLETYRDRFLNVHLGLSPYYRGSGTNVWPLINNEPSMVGATFMYIDEGIDTGKIIHQIRADLVLGDGPHAIGNRLIKKMTDIYCDIVARFDELTDEEQPSGAGKLYLRKHFDARACARLYENFANGLVKNYLDNVDPAIFPYIVKNHGLGVK